MRTVVPTPTWLPLDASRLKNIGGKSPERKSFRVFGLGGKPFPRLIISVWRWMDGGYKIVASRKDGSKSWWGDVSIPDELLPVVPEMIAEVLEKRTQVPQVNP